MLLWLYHWHFGLFKLTVCPWKVLTGRSQPSLHTWMHMSVLQEAKVVLFCQSTSRAGAVNTNNRGNIRDHIKETAIPNNFPSITYLDETVYRLVPGHLLPVIGLIETVWRAQIIFSIPVDNLDTFHSTCLWESFGLSYTRGGKTLPPPSLPPATHIIVMSSIHPSVTQFSEETERKWTQKKCGWFHLG